MKKLFFIFIFAATAAVSATEDIKGEFGFILGEHLDRNKEKFLTFTQNLKGIYFSEEYKFPSPIPGIFYKNYTLHTTRDKKIAIIEAYATLKDYKDFNECKEKAEKVVDYFSLKYMLPVDKFYNKNEKFNSVNHTIRKNEKGINISCNDYDDNGELSVEIFDRKLIKNLPDPLSKPNIEGAFGFKFGEKFDLTRKDYEVNKNFDSPNIEAIHLYHSIPSPFDEYILMVDPKTIEIHGIYALQYSSKNCPNIINEYGRAIEDKYDIGMEKESSDYSESLSYSKEDIIISVSCIYQDLLTGTNKKYPKFQIMYLNKKLFDKSRISFKQLEIERAKKIDKSLL